MKTFKKAGLWLIVRWLLIIGALNWGLIGAFNFNLVTYLFGFGTITQIIYILVGIAALLKIFRLLKK